MKHALKVVALGAGLGLILAVIQRGLGIDEAVFLRGYWIAAPVILLGAVLFSILYQLSYQRRVRALVPLLQEGRAEEFAAGMEQLLQTARGKGLRSLLQLNLAAGQLAAGQTGRAVRLLEELAACRFRGPAEAVRRLNLCLGYFRGGQCGQALALYRESRPMLQSLRERGDSGGSLAELEVLAAAADRRYEQAEALLRAAQTRWTDPRLQEDFRRIGEFLAEQKAEGPRPPAPQPRT